MTFYLEVGGMKECEKGGQFKFLKEKAEQKQNDYTKKFKNGSSSCREQKAFSPSKMTFLIFGTPVTGFLSFIAIFVTHTYIRCFSTMPFFLFVQSSSLKKKLQLSIKNSSFDD